DENIDFANAEITEDGPVIILALHRVGVHAIRARIRKKFGERLLNFLRAGAGKTDSGIPATFIRANQRNLLAVATNMAGAFLCEPMISERDAAIRATADIPAFGALQRSRIAAPVQKQNRLLPALQPLRNGFLELW